MAATSLGTLMLNSSNWRAVNVFYNLTSKIPPSGNLDYFTPYSPLQDSNYTYLRFNDRLSPIDEAVMTALDYYFRPDVFSHPGLCGYPVSGQYGFLNRLLFYVLMIFALIARRHSWLAAAALGTAMTYAASAAVHAFALLVQYKYRTYPDPAQDISKLETKDLGDVDLQAIFTILVASSIMLTPILNWSIQIREHARAIAVYWGLLIYTALVPTFVKARSGIVPLLSAGQLFTCNIDTANNCSMEHARNISLASFDFYTRCNCSDTCGAISFPNSPFRKNQNLQAYLISDRLNNISSNGTMIKVSSLNAVVLCFITIHGIFSMPEINLTQAALRNKVFLLISGGRPYGGRRSLLYNARYYSGRLIASSLFLCAVMVAILSPFIFISSVIINEIGTWDYPISEQTDAVGQWGPWVSAAFVLVAEIIQRYHRAWGKRLLLMLPEPCQRFILCFSRDEDERHPKQEPRREEEDKHHGIFKHFRDSIDRSWERVDKEWTDFWAWWDNPFSNPSEHSDKLQSDNLLSPKEPENMPPSYSNPSLQSPEPSMYRGSDTLLLPLDTTRPPLQPMPYDPGLSEEAEMEQGTVHRSTYERRTSSFASSY